MTRTWIFATAAISAINAGAYAADKMVSFDRAGLTETGEAAALYEKLEKASKRVCAKEYSAPYNTNRQKQACAERALEEAIAEIGSPELSAYALGLNERKVASSD